MNKILYTIQKMNPVSTFISGLISVVRAGEGG